jgi:hypothetical protein
MVPLNKFDLINYSKPQFLNNEKPLTNIIGFDTETRKEDAQPFLYCTSLGEELSRDNFLVDLFQPQYHYANFVTWNLKFDGSSFMKIFPKEFMDTLHKEHKAELEFKDSIYKFKYVPSHKCYVIRKGKIKVTFWDIQPFYGKRTRLESAASNFLNEHKLEIDPNLFTQEYIDDNRERIRKYCIQDAVLTQKLAVKWINDFSKTGMIVPALYSQANVSFAYFCKETNNRIVTAWDIWSRGHKKCIQLAFESYQGGKFEMQKKGAFYGYEYDISSAYPFEIANLIDTKGCRIYYSKKIVKEAVYGFARVRIRNLTNKAIPTGIMHKGVRVYPKGVFYATVTKNEIEYLREIGVEVSIIEGAWITVSRRRYPYRKIINDLYHKKTIYKKTDPTLANNYKIIMNSFYGKMAQCNLTPEGDYAPGKGWNPIYAAVITANVRISLCRIQNMFPDSIIACHTDSVISTKPITIPGHDKGMGSFEFVEKGDGILIMCGIYALNDCWGTRGFTLKKKDDENYYQALKRMLMEHENKLSISVPTKRVESWVEATNKGHDPSIINYFQLYNKEMNINADKKRDWGKNSRTTCKQLTKNLYTSKPLTTNHPDFILNNSQPDYWI